MGGNLHAGRSSRSPTSVRFERLDAGRDSRGGGRQNADAAAMPDLSAREWLMLGPIAAAVLWMGVYPESFLAPMRADIQALDADMGNPVPVEAVMESLMRDGDLTETTKFGNRVAVFWLEMIGADEGALDDAEELLEIVRLREVAAGPGIEESFDERARESARCR